MNATPTEPTDTIDPTTPMRTVPNLPLPPDLRALLVLLCYAEVWTDTVNAGVPGPSDAETWAGVDLMAAAEQTRSYIVGLGGISLHTLELVLRFATIMERRLAAHHERDKLHAIDPPDPEMIAMERVPGWRTDTSPKVIHAELIDRAINLAHVFDNKANDSETVGAAAAEVAIRALMLADFGGALGLWSAESIARAQAAQR